METESRKGTDLFGAGKCRFGEIAWVGDEHPFPLCGCMKKVGTLEKKVVVVGQAEGTNFRSCLPGSRIKDCLLHFHLPVSTE